MSPGIVTNPETGELRDADAYADVQPEPAKPKDTTPSGPTPAKPEWPTFTSLTEIEAYRAELARDIYHPARKDFALLSYVAEAEHWLAGHQDGARVIGVVHETGKMKAPDAEGAGTYDEMPEAGVLADRPEQDAALRVMSNLGGASVEIYRALLFEATRLYASGPPPDDIALHQQLIAKWPSLAERQALDARLDDLHTALDRMLAKEGVKPAQRERWLSELERMESYGAPGIDYLLGPLQQSLWDRAPAAWAEAYAQIQSEDYQRQEAAKRRTTPAEDPTRELGRFGRP